MEPASRRHRANEAALAALACVAMLSCGGSGSSPTAPQMPAATPAPSPSSILGGYGTQPCCCGFWDYTFTRGAETTSWSCWGWIEIRSQSGADLTGYTDMEKDATACLDHGKCVNGSFVSSGRLDSSGSFSWTHGAGDWYSRQVAERNGCTVVGDDGTMTGTLVAGAVNLSARTTFRCGQETAELTLSARGVKIY